MRTNPVARAYAEALLGLARERDKMDEIGAQLSDLAAQVHTHADIYAFLAAPNLEPASKKRALEQALRGQVDDVLVDFACLLVDKGRMTAIGDIAAAYAYMADEVANRRRVFAATAVPMDDQHRSELEKLLREHFKSDCIVNSQVRPDLLGGIVLTVGDKVFDGSVRRQLTRVGAELMRSSGYEN